MSGPVVAPDPDESGETPGEGDNAVRVPHDGPGLGVLSHADVVHAFARAVAKPGGQGRVLTVGEDGFTKVAGEWLSLRTLADLAVAFMVEVAPNTLAVDADSPEEIEALRGLASEIEAAGMTPVVVESGRGLHLFARMARSWVKRWSERASELGLGHGVRSGSQPIRPPLSPHPRGLPVRIVNLPVADALAALTAQPPRAGAMSARMVRLLRDGEWEGRYPSLSEAVQAIATSMVTVGRTRRDLVRAMTDERNALARQVAHSHHARDLVGWLGRSWDKAQRFVADNPPEDTTSRLEVTILQAEQAVLRAGLRKKVRPVLAAHATAAWQAGSVVHSLPRRIAAQEAGVKSLNTVDDHRAELVALGVLEEGERGTGHHATGWTLTYPTADERNCTPTDSHPQGDPDPENRGAEFVPSATDPEDHRGAVVVPPETDPLDGRTWAPLLATDWGNDAFRWGALGRSAPDIIAVMSGDVPMTPKAIHAALPPKAACLATVRNVLRKMRAAGMAFPVNEGRDGWLLVKDSPADLARAAEVMGKAGKRDVQIAANAAYREARAAERREWFRRYGHRDMEPPPTPEAYDDPVIHDPEPRPWGQDEWMDRLTGEVLTEMAAQPLRRRRGQPTGATERPPQGPRRRADRRGLRTPAG